MISHLSTPVQTATQDRRFSLDELCTLADTPRRTVRYYIQQGLLARPEGQRRGAYYTRDHLEQLLFIARWQREGLSLERIGELLHGQTDPSDLLPQRRPGSVEVWSHLAVGPGVELQVEPGQAGISPEQVRALFNEVLSVYRTLRASAATAQDQIQTSDEED